MTRTGQEETLLGYLGDSPNESSCDRRLFPSKFGGKPSWLDPCHIPSARDLKCDSCGCLLTFLLQLYAAQGDNEDAFHRSLFVFYCSFCRCKFTVLRNQLPRKNPYYDYDPFDPECDDAGVNNEDAQRYGWCALCGCRAGCCSSADCSTRAPTGGANAIPADSGRLVVDYSVPIDIEEPSQPSDSDDDSSTTSEQEEEPNKSSAVAHVNDGPDEDASGQPVEKHENDGRVGELLREYREKTEDETLDASEREAFQQISKEHSPGATTMRFLERQNEHPTQIVRYCHGGKPLWFNATPVPPSVPACERCGSERVFEFQIQPSLIYVGDRAGAWRGVEPPEFSVVSVFTCKGSCGGGGGGDCANLSGAVGDGAEDCCSDRDSGETVSATAEGNSAGLRCEEVAPRVKESRYWPEFVYVQK
eukprot:GHVU01142711.1.p1 GENE.GHVU01142711.1~~GHVU01142711.1.p1  ORF type:complete len:418 (-),score=45.33 GHVU01142711.1:477-1730(-)